MTKLHLLVLTITISLFPISNAQAQFLIGDDAIQKNDLELMHKNWDRLVSQDLVGVALKWKNPETGHYGTQEVLKNYTDGEDRKCKTVKYMKASKHSKSVFTYVMERCLFEDGSWKFK